MNRVVQPDDGSIYLDTLNRLIDGLTPILTNLNSIPQLMERLETRTTEISHGITNSHNRIDALALDREQVNALLDVMRRNNELMAQFIAVQQKSNEIEAQKLQASTDLKKIKLDIVRNTIITMVGSGGLLVLVAKGIFALLGGGT